MRGHRAVSSKVIILCLPKEAEKHILDGHIIEPDARTGEYISPAGFVSCSCGMSFRNGFNYPIDRITGKQGQEFELG